MGLVCYQILFKVNYTVWIIGRTALHGAALIGHLEVVRFLVQAGTDKDIQDEDGIFSNIIIS